MARKILITGAEGQLGKALHKVLEDKYDVIPTVRENSISDKIRNVQVLNITKRDDVMKTMQLLRPDIIINCAAYVDVDVCEINKNQAHLVNVVGLENLINGSDHDTFIIQISSDYVFNGDSGPYSEEDHTYPINYYGKTKLEAENILRGCRRNYLIIRSNVIYSEDLFCKSNFFAWVYKSLINSQAISVVNDQISNPTYVAHLAEAIFKCIILRTQGIYHYGGDHYISRYEFAIAIAEHFELNINLISPIDTEELSQNVPSYIARRPQNSGLKTSKIENEIGLSTYSTNYSLNKLKYLL